MPIPPENRARGWVTPCVRAPNGNLSNHHRCIDPVWGEIHTDRVTPETATHFIVVAIDVQGRAWADVATAPTHTTGVAA